MQFLNRVALVTGASRGIGKAIAIMFAQRGAHVAVHYHQRREAAEGVLAELQSLPEEAGTKTSAAIIGAGHAIFQADLADPNSIPPLIDSIVRTMGRLDIVVNNAGIYESHPIMDVDYAQWQAAWRHTLETNLTGPANITYCAARYMAEHGGGRIINISSRGAFRGEPNMPAYGASKAGLNAMSQSLAQALAPRGVYVYVVAPGWVETDMAADALAGPMGDSIRAQSPFNRVAKPEEVAYAVLALAAEGAEFMSGAIVDVNGALYLRS